MIISLITDCIMSRLRPPTMSWNSASWLYRSFFYFSYRHNRSVERRSFCKASKNNFMKLSDIYFSQQQCIYKMDTVKGLYLLLCPHIMILLFVNDFIHSNIPNSASFRHTVTTGWSLYNNTLPWTFNFVIDVIWEEIQLVGIIICIISRFIRTNKCYRTNLNIISCICRFQIKIYKYIKFSICLAKFNKY